ncbi:hypothetical protein [Arthrobacter sp. HLT1-20]
MTNEKLGRSFESVGRDGVSRSWPNRQDYAEFHTNTGDLEGPEYFPDAYRLHPATFLDWVKRGQTGCRFASRLARDDIAARWESVLISKNIPSEDLATHVCEVILSLDKRTELVQLIFPHIEEIDQLIGLINDLCAPNLNWFWEAQDSYDDGWVDVGLRWILPDGEHVAWALGFGPFEFLPVTRRAPIASIVLRTSPLKRTSETRDGHDLIPVHAADMDDLLDGDDDLRKLLTSATKESKLKYVAEEHAQSARARVTFKLPRENLCDPH